MKKRIVLFLLALLPISMFGVEIGYKFTSEGFEYEVIGKDSVSVVGCSDIYEDVVVMPDYVYDGDTRYTVVSIGDGWGPLKWMGTLLGGSRLKRLHADKLYLPQTLKRIGSYSFTYINSVRRIIIPDGVEEIGRHAFSDNETGLDSLWLPASLKKVSDELFSNSKALEYVYIPEGVTLIESCAFSGCKSLESITIPNSVTTIYGGGFYGCSSLTSVKLPDGIKSIPNSMFESCTSLTSFDIPSTVETIGSSAFLGTSLGSIDIPNSVTFIDESAFASCPYLRHVRLSSSLTVLPRNVFKGSMITSVTIPEKVVKIQHEAFGDCNYLTDITVEATTPPTAYNESFSNYGATVWVPRGCISAYERANGWSLFARIVEKEEESGAFYLMVEQPSGVVGFKVQEGVRQELMFTPDAGFNIHSVSLNGTDVTALVEPDGTFVTPAIHSDMRVAVVFGQDVLAIPALRGDSPQVRMGDGAVMVSGCEPGGIVRMYGSGGKLLCATRADEKGAARLAVTESGPVIVTTADRRFKLFAHP